MYTRSNTKFSEFWRIIFSVHPGSFFGLGFITSSYALRAGHTWLPFPLTHGSVVNWGQGVETGAGLGGRWELNYSFDYLVSESWSSGVRNVKEDEIPLKFGIKLWGQVDLLLNCITGYVTRKDERRVLESRLPQIW